MQTCCCGKETRSVLCGSQESFEIRYLCGKVCCRDLDCGRHRCDRLCHPGPCDGCPLQPSRVTDCPCGKTALDKIPTPKPRRKCTDEVPTCQLTCLKPLLCGTDGNLDFFVIMLHLLTCSIIMVLFVVVVIAQQLFSYRQLSRSRKSATSAGLSHRSCTVSCVGWL